MSDDNSLATEMEEAESAPVARKRHRWPVYFFCLGLLMQVLALFGDHATEFPFVLRILAPSHWNASVGFEKVLNQKKLEKSEAGFAEISQILLEDFRKRNKVMPTIRDIAVEKIWLEVQAVRGPQPVEGFTLVDFEFSTSAAVYGDGGRIGFMTLERMREAVAQLKDPNVLIFCILVFVLGSLIEVVAFYFERTGNDLPSGGK